MDDPTLSGWGDNTTSGQGGDQVGGVPGIMGIPGMGGYGYRRGGFAGTGRVPGGWSGGLLPARGGGYSQSPAGLLSKVLPPGPSALRPQQVAPSAEHSLTAALQALIAQNMRRMLVQGNRPPPSLLGAQQGPQGMPGANPALGRPQQAAPSPFGQPAAFGGQGPPGGGMRPLTANSPGP
jgi:hypothetical protein